MDLHDIQERIRGIRRDAGLQRHDAALEQRDELLYDIIQDDAGIHIITCNDVFFVAPVREDDPRDFLRVFTDEALAHAKAAELEGAQVDKFTSLDFLRLAKWLFLRGVYGAVLNEGDEWIVAPLHDFIRVFLERALPETMLYSEEFVNCALLIAAVRKNAAYGLSCALVDHSVNIALGGGLSGYICPKDEAKLPVDSAVLVPVDLQTLFHFEGVVQVTMSGQSFRLDGPRLAEVLGICGVTRETEEFEPAQHFFDEPTGLEAASSALREISDLSLCFAPPKSGTTEEEPTETVMPEAVPQEEASGGGKRLLDIAQKAAPLMRDTGKQIAGAAVLTWRRLLGTRWKKGLVAAVLLTSVIVVVAAVFALRGVRTSGQFQKALSQRDYTAAYRLYLEDGGSVEKDRYVAEEIDALVDDYIHENVNDAELDACLSALSVFPGQTVKLATAYAVSAKLKASKAAYRRGVETEAVLEKLRCWQDVIALDEDNYRSVLHALEANREAWLRELLDAVADQAYVDRETAIELVGIAAGFYPDDPEIAAWCQTFQNERERAALSRYPIHISSIVLERGGAFDSVAIHIKWENTSVKTIASLAFLFQFCDEAGEVVTYKKRGESIVVFKGEESAGGPYRPSFAVTSESWGWSGLWKGKGSRIREVKLTAVQINFADGSTSEYADAQELLKMQE